MNTATDPRPGVRWLHRLLQRGQPPAYLRRWGAPTDVQAFRERVPLCGYEDLTDWIARVADGEPDVLFAGRAVAFERTGGSASGGKLIPYSAEGLMDFQRALAPWLAQQVRDHRIDGSVYLATSPATRAAASVGRMPVGLPDGAYLGEEWGTWVARHSAVPLELALETDIGRWRERTLQALGAARDLQMISVWSPTFLLALLDGLPDPQRLWPQLRIVSCWADAGSAGFARQLQARLPHAHLQPKGLLSTEGVVTVPDAQDRPVLQAHGFFEFGDGSHWKLEDELVCGERYSVAITTASGLYRYRSGDLVRCSGHTETGRPVLVFEGREGLVSDLVGEKLSDAFVSGLLPATAGMACLAVRADRRGYELLTEPGATVDLAALEQRLCANPQYAYARVLGQLQPLVHRPVPQLLARYTRHRVQSGTRLADVKPLALLTDAAWSYNPD